MATGETGHRQASGHRSPRKIDVTGKLTVASVSVVTLIRTDTTLDHSQKAEKVCSTLWRPAKHPAAKRPRRAQTEHLHKFICKTAFFAQAKLLEEMLRAARSRRPPLPEIVLWSTASQHPSESQTSECSDLLSRSRATCLIVAQRQPGKLNNHPHPTQLSPGKSNATGANRRPPQKTTSAFGRFEEMLAARSRAKIEKVTLDDPKLTAIFSKRRKIGAS